MNDRMYTDMWTVSISIARMSSILPVIPNIFLTQIMTSFMRWWRWTLNTHKSSLITMEFLHSMAYKAAHNYHRNTIAAIIIDSNIDEVIAL